MKNIKSYLLGVLLTFSVAGTQAADSKSQDIVDVAIGAGSFKTLVAVVKAADLVETLNGDGHFTVFAPTDKAFGKLPKGTLESLLKPENKKKLQNISSNHVVAAKVSSSKMSAEKVAMVNKKHAKISINKRKVMIDKANVVNTDVMASNGLIHVIDQVILPYTKN